MFTNTFLHAHFKCIKQRRICIVDICAPNLHQQIFQRIPRKVAQQHCHLFLFLFHQYGNQISLAYNSAKCLHLSGESKTRWPGFFLQDHYVRQFCQDTPEMRLHIRKNKHILGCINSNTDIQITHYPAVLVLCQPE